MLITLYEERPCFWGVGHKDYMSRDSKDVAYSQIELLMSDKYDVSREDYKSKWKSVYIIACMRSSFVFATECFLVLPLGQQNILFVSR